MDKGQVSAGKADLTPRSLNNAIDQDEECFEGKSKFICGHIKVQMPCRDGYWAIGTSEGLSELLM